MTKRERFIDEARKLLGTPFHVGARVPGVGIDCLGVLLVASDNAELGLKDHIDYHQKAKRFFGDRLTKAMEKGMQRIPKTGFDGGDVVLFALDPRCGVCHMGIITYDGTIIHAHPEAGRVFEQDWDDELNEAVIEVYKLHGIDDV